MAARERFLASAGVSAQAYHADNDKFATGFQAIVGTLGGACEGVWHVPRQAFDQCSGGLAGTCAPATLPGRRGGRRRRPLADSIGRRGDVARRPADCSGTAGGGVAGAAVDFAGRMCEACTPCLAGMHACPPDTVGPCPGKLDLRPPSAGSVVVPASSAARRSGKTRLSAATRGRPTVSTAAAPHGIVHGGSPAVARRRPRPRPAGGPAASTAGGAAPCRRPAAASPAAALLAPPRHAAALPRRESAATPPRAPRTSPAYLPPRAGQG